MSIDEGIKMYNGILLSHEKDEIMPFAAVWMNPESIRPSDVSQTKTSILRCQLYVKPKI